jgi:hypothetical protein
MAVIILARSSANYPSIAPMSQGGFVFFFFIHLFIHAYIVWAISPCCLLLPPTLLRVFGVKENTLSASIP